MKLALFLLCACAMFGQPDERSAILPAPLVYPSPGSGAGLFLAQNGSDNICVRRISQSYTISFTAMNRVIVKHPFHSTNIQIVACNVRSRLILPAVLQATDLDTITVTFDEPTSGIIRVIKPQPDAAIFWPQMAYAGAGAFDIASSWGAQELNPIAGRGTFGPRQAVMSASITAGVVLASHIIVKKWPSSRRVMKWSLIGGALVRGYASSRAVQLHATQ